jgi:hypothetical protein
MTCAGLFCLAAELSEAPPAYVRPNQPRPTTMVTDSTITKGLRFLGKSFDAITKGGAIDAWSRLYFLWSLERVAVIYGLETIGSQEWYPWTAELLVRDQQSNGSWWDSGPGPVPTCFALLILRRSNLTPDLLVGVPGMTQPKKPVGDFRQPLVQEPSSNRVPNPGPDRRTKTDADKSDGPPVYRVPTPVPAKPQAPDYTIDGTGLVRLKEVPPVTTDNKSLLTKKYRPKVLMTASSTWPGWPPVNAIDDSIETSWFSARNDAAAHGTSPWLQVNFPEDVAVSRVTILGNRDPHWLIGFTILEGSLTLYDRNGEVLKTVKSKGTGNFRDFDFHFSPAIEAVRAVRFTSLADQGNQTVFGDIAIADFQVE